MSVFPLQLAFYFYWIITFHKRTNLSAFQVVWYSIEILERNVKSFIDRQMTLFDLER